MYVVFVLDSETRDKLSLNNDGYDIMLVCILARFQ